MAEQLANLQNGELEKYSTNEQLIGVWTDGKPLYRSILTGTLANATNTDIDLSSLSINEICSFSGIYINSNIAKGIPRNGGLSQGYQADWWYSFTNKNLTISVGQNERNSPYKIVLTYTKS